jgi:5-formyltetrahydrofolate cyclo-ligase
MDLASWRRETRTRLIDARQKIPAGDHQRWSLSIEASLEQALGALSPQTFSLYWPFRGEVDLRALAERLEMKGWQASLPSVVGRGKSLEFLRWISGAEMDVQSFGIPVPRVREVVRPSVVIMPLVGFDALNYRLGYGAGYFDITLASMEPPPHSVGIGFELSRLDTIHPLPTDVPVDLVITEAGIQKRGQTTRTPNDSH